MGRAPCCDKNNVKKGPWSPEEDANLKAYIEKYGTGGNWIALPKKIGLKRCGKSCRLRWLNYLRPNIKHGGFSEEEDNIICSLYISIGSRWSIIAAQLPGRTDNDIKNYWNTKLKKKLLGRRKQSSNLSRLDDDTQHAQGLSNSALERLQLHMQLQTLQNPLSSALCNNNNNSLAVWLPNKLHPLQEKMIQTSLNIGNHNPALLERPQPIPSHNVTLQQDYSSSDGSVPSFVAQNTTSLLAAAVVGIDQQSHNNAGIQHVSSFQSELDEFLNTKTAGIAHQEGHMADFDCFNKQLLNGSKDQSMAWWSTTTTAAFDAKCASSNSWDSTSAHQSEGMFQDYELGYNM